MNTPELLGETTVDLVRHQLLLQVFPNEVPRWYGERFEAWLANLGSDELHARQAALCEGKVEEIHSDKWLSMAPALRAARELRLVSTTGASSGPGWIQVESRTANEFVASLAVALYQTVMRVLQVASPSHFCQQPNRLNASAR
jgi:hypothetical protein